jgi:hypothetical protein
MSPLSRSLNHSGLPDRNKLPQGTLALAAHLPPHLTPVYPELRGATSALRAKLLPTETPLLAARLSRAKPRGRYFLSLSILWRPFLRAVVDVCDFHNILADSVHHHERKRWQRKFTRPFHTARSALVGKRLQRTSTLVDGLGYALSGGRIFLPDVFDNSENVFNGGG